MDLIGWLSAFTVTQVVEVPFYVSAIRRVEGRTPGTWPGDLARAFSVSLLTHPVVYLAWPALWPGSGLTGVISAEAFAVGAEALWLLAFGVRASVAWALVANLTSLAVGLSLRAWVGWP